MAKIANDPKTALGKIDKLDAKISKLYEEIEELCTADEEKAIYAKLDELGAQLADAEGKAAREIEVEMDKLYERLERISN